MKLLRNAPWIGLLLVVVTLGLWLTRGPGRARMERPLLTVDRGDVVHSTQASGRIVPREEVFIRSLVAGVLDELRVRPGDVVHKGDELAVVRIVADPVLLSDARRQVKLAQAKVVSATREVKRVAPFGSGGAVSQQDLARAQDNLTLAATELASAREHLRLLAEGAASEHGTRSTRIVAPIDGTILAVPVAIGDVIADTNSYRDGSTIAVVADMTQLLFKGYVEEAHVGKLTIGMPATVRIGAIEGSTVPGQLSWIAPRAVIESPAAPTNAATASAIAPLTATSSGITRFEVWISLSEAPRHIRAGYSATAELTLERRDGVLLIEERALRFEVNKAFVLVQRTDGSEHMQEVQVGVSDGVKIEVISGLAAGERVALADAP